MSKNSKSKPIPINGGSDKIKYHRVPSYRVPSSPRSDNIDPILEEKKQRIKKIYRYKIVSNFFRLLYLIASLLIIFSPHVWNKDWSFNIKDENFKIGLFSVIGGCAFINLLNSCLHYFLISIFLVIADIFKFVMCARVSHIEKDLDHKDYEDYLKEFGYILCVVFVIIDLVLVFTTYKIYDLYKRPRY